MKKHFVGLLSVLLCATLLLSACERQEEQGKVQQEEQQEVMGEYNVLEVHEDSIEAFIVEDGRTHLRTQYFQGEPVQIKAEVKKDENSNAYLDIYLYSADGEQELLVSGVSIDFRRQNWFLAADKSFYVWSMEKYAKLDANGTVVFSGTVDSQVISVCETGQGQVILWAENTDGGSRLIPLDAASGSLNEASAVYMSEGRGSYITGREENVLLFCEDGIYEIHLGDGSRELKVSLANLTEGNLSMADFRIEENGKVAALQNTYIKEMETVDVTEEKQVIVVCSSNFTAAMNLVTAEYNKQSDDYYVVLDMPSDDEELSDYYQRIQMEYSAGKGADIYTGNAGLDVLSILEKGGFEVLNSYMEESGIVEEDYFPVAFLGYRDGENIYSVLVDYVMAQTYISKELLGSNENPTLEELLTCLENYESEAVFTKIYTPKYLLRYFIGYSENLWGIVDWEQGTCNFQCELFISAMELAKRYGYESRKAEYPELAKYGTFDVYSYEDQRDLEAAGWVAVGDYIEDGAHMAASPRTAMMINSSSTNKEGAWDYLRYLLQEGQMAKMECTKGGSFRPVSKSAYDAFIQQEIEEGAIVHYIKDGKSGKESKAGNYDYYKEMGEEAYKAKYDMTEEKGVAIKPIFENIRVYTTRNEPVMEIVYEEAEQYFSGDKTIEEIIPIIENRVQLYLEEHK